MAEALDAIFEGSRVGRIHYANDRLSFVYEDAWREDSASFPLSLSMTLAARKHDDAVVRAFIWGLLPDNTDILRHWGRSFQVSAGNPFRLLSHVGEECAGAVQFVAPDRAKAWLDGDAPEGVAWLSDDELIERIEELVRDHGRARRSGDEGHFSLAGAQVKTGLYRDPESGQWGIPKGATPTTHILKPNVGDFDGYDLNEHFCLRLARAVGMSAAESWTEVIGQVPVIVVKRFDRASIQGRILRIHQEDCCQALARMPDAKYQREGGPSAAEMFSLIRDRSARAQEDVERFLDALIFNWLIGGTDAHGKNYGFLLSSAGQVRLAPLYDLSSCLPYPREVPLKKAKLAMKVGGQYRLHRVGPTEWEKAAREWHLSRDLVIGHVTVLAQAVHKAATDIQLPEATDAGRVVLTRLAEALSDRAASCLGEFAG